MESNERYFRRRAIQEVAAARRAVTHSALARRRSLAEVYLRKLGELTGTDEMRMLDGIPVLAGGHGEDAVARNWILEEA